MSKSNFKLSEIKKSAWAWAFYDWANSSFATTVLAALFPVFFKAFWSTGASVSESTAKLGFTHTLASTILAISSPLLGILADRTSKRKFFLAVFTLMGVLATSSLFWVQSGQWEWAIALFVIGNIGFAGGNLFYDAFLCLISKEKDYEFFSALGYALGYLGGGILFAINILMILKFDWFGFASQSIATRYCFLSVGLWWGVFSLPLLIWVEEPKQRLEKLNTLDLLKPTLLQLALTFKDIIKNKNLVYFVLAYFCYIDGLNTIMKMAVDYGMAIGLPSDNLILAILLVQFVGFPATLLMNRFAERFGNKPALYFCIFIYAINTIGAFLMKSSMDFFLLSIMIAIVQGATQSISRAVFAGMIPQNQTSEYFGFFNMLGKFSAVLGPAIVGIVSMTTQSPRISILSILILFISGGLFLNYTNISKTSS